MALATRGTNFCKPDVVRYEWELAKELGINITVHVAMDRFGYTKMQLRGLKDLGLLYPNTTYIHSSHLLDDEWQLVADSGGNVSLAPQIEMQMGHGWAPAATADKLGIPIGLLVRRGDDGVVRPVHPDARDLRVGARRAGTRRPGTTDLDGNTPTRRTSSPSRQVLRWATHRRREGRRASPTGRARSRRARRPTS